MKDFQSDLSSVVRLNIGGKKFCTTTGTLTQREPDSLLAAMDGKHFRHILNWLRDGVVPTLEESRYSELLREAEYYQLLGLVDGVHAVLNKRKEDDESHTELTRTDIIKCIQSEKVRFRGVNLSGLDLSKLDLSYVDFSYACLKNVFFSRANLQCAKFRDVDAEASIFHNATLRECEFTGANLRGALLAGACLQSANLQGLEEKPTQPKRVKVDNILNVVILTGPIDLSFSPFHRPNLNPMHIVSNIVVNSGRYSSGAVVVVVRDAQFNVVAVAAAIVAERSGRYSGKSQQSGRYCLHEGEKSSQECPPGFSLNNISTCFSSTFSGLLFPLRFTFLPSLTTFSSDLLWRHTVVLLLR
ncbi:FH protein interacting protein FIP2, partial [Mucuna pruriens]